MTALAAARLGYRSHVFTDEADGPGVQVTALSTIAELGDPAALEKFARSVDVVTYETENIPLAAIDAILPHAPVLPGRLVLEIAQDRLREKDWLRSIDVATAPYREVLDAAALARAIRDLDHRAVLKTVRFGYDGKGQVAIRPDSDPAAAWAEMGGEVGILETFIDYRCEVSVVVARSRSGTMVNYPVVENQHVNHILDTTIAPARIDAELAMRAEAIARHVADRLGVVGLIAVEMFVTRDGEILVNELAPRPHNSAHWTLDACHVSQFEQLVRALAGLPLGPTEAHAEAVMRNIIGRDVERWREHVGDPMTRLHLYGKTEARPGRKMGHVTRLVPRR
jgi:5-(carboxyamino)imidazole ribonucleotide synthase